MKLYEITLHFPDPENAGLTLKSVEYYENEEQAIKRAKVVAYSFAAPKPDYFYLEDGGFTIWTDYPEQVKKATHYDLLTSKPEIKPITKSE